MTFEQVATARLVAIDAANRRRALVPIEPAGAMTVRVAGREVVLFSSNDYLGLSTHLEVRAAVAEAAERHGLGPRGSALVCGHTTHHEALAQELASFVNKPACLLFPTGFGANGGALGAVAGQGAAIFSDALNHASIIDGCRLTRAQVQVYRHADVSHLETLLKATPASVRVVVTDAVFGMDGDLAPLRDIAALKQRHEFIWIVDEAHASLVFGPGLAGHLGVEDAVDLHVGTLSKAFGAQGGFVATSERGRDLLVNTARTNIFSTALPLPVVAGVRAALRVGPARRAALWQRVAQLGHHLGRTLASPIAPILLGDETRTMAAARALLEAGHHVVGIRPPTVPEGTSRLRIALSSEHTPAQIDALAAALTSLN